MPELLGPHGTEAHRKRPNTVDEVGGQVLSAAKREVRLRNRVDWSKTEPAQRASAARPVRLGLRPVQIFFDLVEGVVADALFPA